jgi:hypothetical protein
MRYFRFRFRRSRFTSIAEINRALMGCVERINDQTHRRFGVSRRERFEKIERAALKGMPSVDYDRASGRRRSCTPTVTLPSMAITTAPRTSTAAKAYESSSQSTMSRSS